jgi:hypothetical protein
VLQRQVAELAQDVQGYQTVERSAQVGIDDRREQPGKRQEHGQHRQLHHHQRRAGMNPRGEQERAQQGCGDGTGENSCRRGQLLLGQRPVLAAPLEVTQEDEQSEEEREVKDKPLPSLSQEVPELGGVHSPGGTRSPAEGFSSLGFDGLPERKAVLYEEPLAGPGLRRLDTREHVPGGGSPLAHSLFQRGDGAPAFSHHYGEREHQVNRITDSPVRRAAVDGREEG